eukprot:364146_1
MGSGCFCSNNDIDDDPLVVNTDPPHFQYTNQKHNEESASHDEISDWLKDIDEQFSNLYHDTFINNGYNTLNMIATIEDINDLLAISIQKQHTTTIMNAIQKVKILLQTIYNASRRTEHKCDNNSIDHDTNTIREWLTSINEEFVQYCANFIENGYKQYGLILQNIHNEQQLNEIGIKSPEHSRIIMKKIMETNEYDNKIEETENYNDSIKSTSEKPLRTEHNPSISCSYNLNETFQDNVQSLSVMNIRPLFAMANDNDNILEPSWKCSGCGSMNLYRRKKCQLCSQKLPEFIISALNILSQSNYEILLPSNSTEQQIMTNVL